MKNYRYKYSRFLVLVLAFVLSFGMVSSSLAAEEKEIPTIGLPELMAMVQANKGKVVMINVFASWCPPCKFEIPGLIRLRTIMSNEDIIFIGLSTDDSMKDLEKFTQKTRFNYPIFMAKQDISQAFRVDAIPFNIVYDRTGKLVLQESGYVEEKDLQNFLNTLVDAR